MLGSLFAHTPLRQWFAKSAAFDTLVCERFEPLTRSAVAGTASLLVILP